MNTGHARAGARAMALSISESPDMPVLGLGPEHLTDALTEIARHLLALESHLFYGGDLRAQGFTQVLLELVLRYSRDLSPSDGRRMATNVLAWPVYATTPPRAIGDLATALADVAELVRLGPDGSAHVIVPDRVVGADDHPLAAVDDAAAWHAPMLTDAEWSAGLSAMRAFVTTQTHARIVLGGRRSGYKGYMPGIAEEALLALRAGQPLYVLGGFGGCAADVAHLLNILPPDSPVGDALGQELAPHTRRWPAADQFPDLRPALAANGLTFAENRILASTRDVSEAMIMILRGLLRTGRARL